MHTMSMSVRVKLTVQQQLSRKVNVFSKSMLNILPLGFWRRQSWREIAQSWQETRQNWREKRQRWQERRQNWQERRQRWRKRRQRWWGQRRLWGESSRRFRRWDRGLVSCVELCFVTRGLLTAGDWVSAGQGQGDSSASAATGGKGQSWVVYPKFSD